MFEKCEKIVSVLEKYCELRNYDQLAGGVHQTKRDAIAQIMSVLIIYNCKHSNALKETPICCWEIGMGIPVLSFAVKWCCGGNVMAIDIGKFAINYLL
jgi:hypothetical protein